MLLWYTTYNLHLHCGSVGRAGWQLEQTIGQKLNISDAKVLQQKRVQVIMRRLWVCIPMMSQLYGCALCVEGMALPVRHSNFSQFRPSVSSCMRERADSPFLQKKFLWFLHINLLILKSRVIFFFKNLFFSQIITHWERELISVTRWCCAELENV